MNHEPLATITGVVEKFTGNGRLLGYPTANLSVPTNLEDGVYFGWAKLGTKTKQPSLIFIGTPTTVGDTERRVEAHILDLADKDYYGEALELGVIYFHRSNENFDSIEELIVVMKDDEVKARSWFGEQ